MAQHNYSKDISLDSQIVFCLTRIRNDYFNCNTNRLDKMKERVDNVFQDIFIERDDTNYILICNTKAPLEHHVFEFKYKVTDVEDRIITENDIQNDMYESVMSAKLDNLLLFSKKNPIVKNEIIDKFMNWDIDTIDMFFLNVAKETGGFVEFSRYHKNDIFQNHKSIIKKYRKTLQNKFNTFVLPQLNKYLDDTNKLDTWFLIAELELDFEYLES